MERLGDALALTPFKCVSTSYKWHANVQQSAPLGPPASARLPGTLTSLS